jgi:hypothetical protein
VASLAMVPDYKSKSMLLKNNPSLLIRFKSKEDRTKKEARLSMGSIELSRGICNGDKLLEKYSGRLVKCVDNRGKMSLWKGSFNVFKK